MFASRYCASAFILLGTAGLCALALCMPGPALAVSEAGTGVADGEQAAPANGRFGLAVTTFRYAQYTGQDDCPEGMAEPPREIYLRTLAEAARTRLRAPERDAELQLLASQAPDGSDVCSSPTAALSRFPNYPGMRQVQGKVAYGLDLDGRGDGDPPAPKTCAHKTFTGVNGEKGIDNQFYRATGCLKLIRWDRKAGESFDDAFDWANGDGQDAINFKMGEMSILIEVSDVQDRRNDADVTVGFYSGRNAMVNDAQGRLIANTSQTATADPRYRKVVKGRIVDGILTTEPADIRFRYVYAGSDTEHVFRGGRLRLALRPEGTAQGLLAGYKPLESVYWWQQGTYGRQMATDMARDCAGMYKALQQMADGYPDPETGQCTAISAAHAINAVPAYIFHPPEAEIEARRRELAAINAAEHRLSAQ